MVKSASLHSLLAALAMSSCGATSNNASTHAWLAAEQPRLETASFDAYWAALGSVFADEHGLVGSGCPQVLLSPGDRPEELVYVDCEGARDGSPSRVVRLVAKQQVSAVLFEQGFEAAAHVPVSRFEGILDAKDSRVLSEIFWIMLQTTRPSSTSVGTPNYHFSTCKALVGCSSGVAGRGSEAGPVADLIEVGRLLAQMTEPDERLRSEVARALRTRAAALRLKLPGR